MTNVDSAIFRKQGISRDGFGACIRCGGIAEPYSALCKRCNTKSRGLI